MSVKYVYKDKHIVLRIRVIRWYFCNTSLEGQASYVTNLSALVYSRYGTVLLTVIREVHRYVVMLSRKKHKTGSHTFYNDVVSITRPTKCHICV